MKYKVYYNSPSNFVAHTFAPSIAHIQHGFWINDNWDFTTGEDAYIWIPASQIHYVKKIEDVISEKS